MARVDLQALQGAASPSRAVVAGQSRWLLGFCTSYGFIMLVFLNYAGVLPLIQREWRISSAAAGSIFSVYQVGYIVSAVFLTSLTDRHSARTIFLLSAFWSAVANVLFALFATDVTSALILRGLAGLGMGGTYMPGLKLVAERFPSEERGRAAGLYTSAFVFGAALSTFLAGVVAAAGGWRLAILTTAVGCLAGSIGCMAALRDLPPPSAVPARRPFRTEVLRNRPALLMIVAYAGHMWEQYGMRGWMVAFLTANLASLGQDLGAAAAAAATLAALIVAIGGVATGLAGILSDRLGRTATVAAIMASSAACSFAFGSLFGAPMPLIFLIGLLYSFVTVAETPVLSAGLTELVPPSNTGAAMGMQTLFGFLAASASPAVFGLVLDWTNPPLVPGALHGSWGWAFGSLGLGGSVGVLAMAVLRRHPESSRMAGGRR
jgi:MFS family permease